MNILFLVLMMAMSFHELIYAMKNHQEESPPDNEIQEQNIIICPKKTKKHITKRKITKSKIYGYQDFKIKEKAYPIIALEGKPTDTVLCGYDWEKRGDPNLAYCYYLKSVDFEGDARGLFMLARYFELGLGFIKKDLKIARKYYQKAAKYGCIDAKFAIATFFEAGKCLFPINNRRALKWYKKAADGKHPHALVSLGKFYQHGIEVPENPEEAFQCYSLSASLEHAPGHYLLGLAYLNGIGTVSNITKARHHLLRAAENNIPAAFLDLGHYYEQNKQDEDAFNLFLEAANQGVVEAYKKIAIYYEEGKGVLKDLFLAEYFYKKSQKNSVANGL
jgi:TPR repeat protein